MYILYYLLKSQNFRQKVWIFFFFCYEHNENSALFFREFPSRLVEGTPDDIRKARFRQAWNTTGVAAKMDFESSDQDLLEDEPELEDGESADDTKDSVVRFLITFF